MLKNRYRTLGLINKYFFKGDDGKGITFGEGGVEKMAKEFNKKVLGNLPLSTDLRISADL